MSSFVLKIIAVISMCFDHFGYWVFGPQITWCNFLGRLAFPIFAYQISEGYTHTHDLKKYIWRLFLFAIISQIPFNLFQYAIGFSLTSNVFFTLLLGLLSICAFEKIPNKLMGIIVSGICIFLGHLLNVDYGYWGVLLVFAFYILRTNKVLLTLGFAAIIMLKYVPVLIQSNFNFLNMYLAIFTFLAIVPILLYNGKQGLKTKYLLYIFYPLHLTILAVATLL